MEYKKPKRSKIRSALNPLVEGDFFKKTGKTPTEVVRKLGAKGYTIKGKKVGMISRMLTQICQDADGILEREEIPKEKRIGNEKWMFKKIK